MYRSNAMQISILEIHSSSWVTRDCEELGVSPVALSYGICVTVLCFLGFVVPCLLCCPCTPLFNLIFKDQSLEECQTSH